MIQKIHECATTLSSLSNFTCNLAQKSQLVALWTVVMFFFVVFGEAFPPQYPDSLSQHSQLFSRAFCLSCAEANNQILFYIFWENDCCLWHCCFVPWTKKKQQNKMFEQTTCYVFWAKIYLIVCTNIHTHTKLPLNDYHWVFIFLLTLSVTIIRANYHIIPKDLPNWPWKNFYGQFFYDFVFFLNQTKII